jgi:hypothetical protein
VDLALLSSLHNPFSCQISSVFLAIVCDWVILLEDPNTVEEIFSQDSKIRARVVTPKIASTELRLSISNFFCICQRRLSDFELQVVVEDDFRGDLRSTYLYSILCIFRSSAHAR